MTNQRELTVVLGKCTLDAGKAVMNKVNDLEKACENSKDDKGVITLPNIAKTEIFIVGASPRMVHKFNITTDFKAGSYTFEYLGTGANVEAFKEKEEPTEPEVP